MLSHHFFGKKRIAPTALNFEKGPCPNFHFEKNPCAPFPGKLHFFEILQTSLVLGSISIYCSQFQLRKAFYAQQDELTQLRELLKGKELSFIATSQNKTISHLVDFFTYLKNILIKKPSLKIN